MSPKSTELIEIHDELILLAERLDELYYKLEVLMSGDLKP